MSPYQQALIGQLKSSGVEAKKLVPNLQSKTGYVLHYQNLQQYVRLGLRVTAFHRALKFKQSAWMKPYIAMNTELRKKATTDFHKDLYKLMNNAVSMQAQAHARMHGCHSLTHTIFFSVLDICTFSHSNNFFCFLGCFCSCTLGVWQNDGECPETRRH